MDSRILSAGTLWKKAEDFYRAINEGSDLDCVIISACYLDQCLASLLQEYFIESRTSADILDPKTGHLSTFQSRADLSYCLGLIPKDLYHNLRLINEIYNAFSHIYPSKKFTDPDIVSLCGLLTLPYKGKTVSVTGNEKKERNTKPFSHFTDSRNRFKITAVLTANRVLLTALSVEGESKETRET